MYSKHYVNRLRCRSSLILSDAYQITSSENCDATAQERGAVGLIEVGSCMCSKRYSNRSKGRHSLIISDAYQTTSTEIPVATAKETSAVGLNEMGSCMYSKHHVSRCRCRYSHIMSDAYLHDELGVVRMSHEGALHQPSATTLRRTTSGAWRRSVNFPGRRFHMHDCTSTDNLFLPLVEVASQQHPLDIAQCIP
jgi:hypothetical protein